MIPFNLFHIDLSFDGFFSFLGSGFLIGFGESDGDGDGDGVGEGETVGLGDAALIVCPPAAEPSPSHQRAVSTPEPRIAISTIKTAAARRSRFRSRTELFNSGTFMRANSGRR